MQVLNFFYAVASMVSGLRLSHFLAFPDVYHLALARVESVICGPPALSPYLNFVCGTVDAVRPTVESSPVVVNLNFNIADFDSVEPRWLIRVSDEERFGTNKYSGYNEVDVYISTPVMRF